MSKKLIIAEKPSLAKNIMAGIGNDFKREDGYAENKDYIVTWAFGHLFGLIDMDDYPSNQGPDDKHGWSLDNLPFAPAKFQFELKRDAKTKKIDSGVKKQFKTIQTLLNRKDVDAVINAGDSDREGEIIVRLILQYAKNTKPVYRLWMPDQTPQTIRSELSAMKPDSNYDNLANEGYARTYIDWLYGVNFTRYATVKSGTLLRVGRVIAPIVRAIYERDMAIKNFVPEKYFGVTSKELTNGEQIELTSKETFPNAQKADAEALCRKYNAADTVVTDAVTERKSVAPGKLYSLSKLQGVLGQRYKMSLKDSLAIIQKLYEAGYLTYPRTNTEYLATAEKGKVKDILRVISGMGLPVAFRDSKSIFDDSKIESHSALTPTTKIPKPGTLSTDEQKVYDTVFNRFVAVFCSESCEVDRSTITISNGFETFTLKGDIMVSKGWMKFDEADKKDKVLPALKKGDKVNVDFKPVEKETAPPKHYTLETLNNFLKNPFKNDDSDNEDEDYKAIMSGAEIGTEATRTGIIENAITSKYITLKNNTYYITDAGIYYVEALEKLHIDVDKQKTVQLGVVLKDVYKGKLSVEESVAITNKEIREVFRYKDTVLAAAAVAEKEEIGKCPKCGSPIYETDKAFSCSNRECKFALWKDNAYFKKFGKKMSKSMAKSFLTKGYMKAKGIPSKSGGTFDATFVVDFSGQYPQFNMQFEDDKPISNTALGRCPHCGANVFETQSGFICEKRCGFTLKKDDKYLDAFGKKLTATLVKKFLADGEAHIKDLKSKKTGKEFAGTIKVDFSEKYPKYSLEFK